MKAFCGVVLFVCVASAVTVVVDEDTGPIEGPWFVSQADEVKDNFYNFGNPPSITNSSWEGANGGGGGNGGSSGNEGEDDDGEDDDGFDFDFDLGISEEGEDNVNIDFGFNDDDGDGEDDDGFNFNLNFKKRSHPMALRRDAAPSHGNFCGSGSGEGDPVDSLDDICRAHEQCYEQLGDYDCRCDKSIVEAVASNFDSFENDAKSAATKTINFYSHADCLCRRRIECGVRCRTCWKWGVPYACDCRNALCRTAVPVTRYAKCPSDE